MNRQGRQDAKKKSLLQKSWQFLKVWSKADTDLSEVKIAREKSGSI